MLLEKDHVNQSIRSMHLGLTYSWPPFLAVVFRAWPFAWYCRETDSSRPLLISRMSRFQDWPFLLAWLLVPYHRQCHTLRGWSTISSLRLDHGISCLFRGRSASNPPNPAADRPPSSSRPICAFKSHLPIDSNSSNVFRTSNHISPDLTPINTRIQLLIHQPANHHIVASHQVQSVRLLGRRLVVALLANDAFDRVG
jgi:hypothetical protein